MNLILASGSPRRRELLSLYTTNFTVCVSDFDESAVQAATPAHLVEQLARGKCLAVSAQHPGAVSPFRACSRCIYGDASAGKLLLPAGYTGI